MNHIKAFFREKGIYLLCLAVALAATMAGILALRRVVGRLTGQLTEHSATLQQDSVWDQPDASVEKPAADVPKPVQTPAAVPTPAPQATPEPTPDPEPRTTPQPVKVPGWYGKPVGDFSGDELVYNKTLGDWRTHNGTDYTALAGKAVAPAAAGTVTAVKNDALWGDVVEVTDAAGLCWRYCGLRQVTVHKGDTVTTGTTLGEIGTLPAEAWQGTHLHLECIKDGEYLDPHTLIG